MPTETHLITQRTPDGIIVMKDDVEVATIVRDAERGEWYVVFQWDFGYGGSRLGNHYFRSLTAAEYYTLTAYYEATAQREKVNG